MRRYPCTMMLLAMAATIACLLLALTTSRWEGTPQWAITLGFLGSALIPVCTVAYLCGPDETSPSRGSGKGARHRPNNHN